MTNAIGVATINNDKRGILSSLFSKKEPVRFSMEERINENKQNKQYMSTYADPNHEPNEWEREGILTMVKGMSYKEKIVCLSYLLSAVSEEDIQKLLNEKNSV